METLEKDFAASHLHLSLRAHQAAIDATESPQRETAAKALVAGRIYSWGGGCQGRVTSEPVGV